MLRHVPGEPLSIVHATPHAWESGHELNDLVGKLALELAGRGHRVAVLAPSDVRSVLRESRRLIDQRGDRPWSLFDRAWKGPRVGGADGPPLVALGAGIPLPRGPRPRAAPLPVDVSRRLEALLAGTQPAVLHVHDPFAPSLSSAALRHSSSLNVGTFHEPSERVLSTQVARPLVEIFFGRLDARTVSSQTTGELIERFFPGSYELIAPGAPRVEPWWPAYDGGTGRPLRIAYCAGEERGALRLFLRALRRLGEDPGWEAAVWAAERTDLRLSRALRDRVRIVGPSDAERERVIAGADVLCACSGGPIAVPGLIRAALANGTVPVASHIPPYAELTRDGELGLLFQPGDAITLAGQLSRLAGSAALRRELISGARATVDDWATIGDRFEQVYRRISGRRHDPRGNPETRRRVSRRREIHVDLHMHTDHSSDCATPVETLLATARDAGLGAIAITDHNEISGALAAREMEDEFGIKVIVAEEVKTAEQGEVIGLFLERKIERGMTMAETIAEIRRQRGLVYVPHPFDRLHSVPDYEHLLEIVEEIDILEVFNPRVALTAFNEEAEKFAAKYRIVPGAGSDSHVAQGLGSVMIRLHDFDGPEEFLEAMRSADIVHKKKNLVYVQTLKWLQTGGGRGGRRVSGSPRPSRAGKR
jgi:predicted metal-dependent phosphoesterase TrpH/glycosyltransferase involved in cell wall biosynthesis